MTILNILVGKIDCIQVVFMCSNSLYYITLLYIFTCLYFRIITVLASYSVLLILYFVLTFSHPGLYWIYGNKYDDDDDDDDYLLLLQMIIAMDNVQFLYGHVVS
jgi:hypothetical protein